MYGQKLAANVRNEKATVVVLVVLVPSDTMQQAKKYTSGDTRSRPVHCGSSDRYTCQRSVVRTLCRAETQLAGSIAYSAPGDQSSEG